MSTTSPKTGHQELIIITGLSGAGKSTALNVFEDAGFYCIDNLPVFLLPALVKGMADKAAARRGIALVMDIRDEDFLDTFSKELAAVKSMGLAAKLIFLDAEESVLLRRYSQLRRAHPLAQGGMVREGICAEKERLNPVKQLADQVIDTSRMAPNELRQKLLRVVEKQARMQITLLSFGHKHGLPDDADLIFDVRFLPNPYYLPDLREKTGKEAEVADYALNNEVGKKFQKMLREFLEFLIPQYAEEGKSYLTIGIGCTGGRHRSVAIAESLFAKLKAGETPVQIFHRDILK